MTADLCLGHMWSVEHNCMLVLIVTNVFSSPWNKIALGSARGKHIMNTSYTERKVSEPGGARHPDRPPLFLINVHGLSLIYKGIIPSRVLSVCDVGFRARVKY